MYVSFFNRSCLNVSYRCSRQHCNSSTPLADRRRTASAPRSGRARAGPARSPARSGGRPDYASRSCASGWGEARPRSTCQSGLLSPWDVRGLADRSSLIIVGRPLAAGVELSDDRRSIATTYSVQVDDMLKGSRLSAFVHHVIVKVPAGRIDFGDGTSAETRSGPALTLGDRYVLFLQHEQDGRSGMPAALPGTSAAATGRAAEGAAVTYRPFHVGQGVFHLEADGKMRSHAQDASDKLDRYDEMPEALFLGEIKATVAARRSCIACFSTPRIRFSLFPRRISRQ